MLFNSIEFLILFLPIVLGLYYAIDKYLTKTFLIVFLILASFVFYGYWNPTYCFLLLSSIILNFVFGKILLQSKINLYITRFKLYSIGIALNLLILCLFKYLDFLIINVNGLFNLNVAIQNIELPLAISFFTFQQIAFITSVYKGEIKDFKLVKYLLFVSFFPQLIAGPIVRFQEFFPQLDTKWKHNRNIQNVIIGIVIFTIGLLKKVLIADNLANIANPIFFNLNSELSPNIYEAWVGLIAFSMQIYFDFSGYSDMAIGLALCFGIYLPDNFLSPYKSSSFREFWKRWHITLSKFLRDHIYIPLGGNRKNNSSTIFNIAITMILGGLWHGASWNFVIWGGYHGFLILMERILKPFLKLKKFPNINNTLLIPIIFFFITLGWVPFKCTNLDATMKMIKILFGFGATSNFKHMELYDPILYILLILLLVWFFPNTSLIKSYIINMTNKNKLNFASLLLFSTVSLAIVLFILSAPIQQVNREFIYFQF